MLLHAGLSGSFWAEVVNLANSIRNAGLTKSVVEITPFQALHNKVPSMERYKVFGCKAMALIQETNLDKFSSKTRDLIYLGPGHGSSGYKLWNLTSRRVIHIRSVTFLEDVFPHVSPDLVLSLISDPFALAYDSDIMAIGHQQESLVGNSPIELGGLVLVLAQGPLPPPPSNRTRDGAFHGTRQRTASLTSGKGTRTVWSKYPSDQFATLATASQDSQPTGSSLSDLRDIGTSNHSTSNRGVTEANPQLHWLGGGDFDTCN
jgi:hypothetical protein